MNSQLETTLRLFATKCTGLAGFALQSDGASQFCAMI